jgi:hypothetical protein
MALMAASTPSTCCSVSAAAKAELAAKRARVDAAIKMLLIEFPPKEHGFIEGRD